MCAAGEKPILILTGAPGSGKTAVAELLAARSQRAVHLESDQFFHFIKAGHIEPWKPESQAQNTVVMGVVAQAAAGYAKATISRSSTGSSFPDGFSRRCAIRFARPDIQSRTPCCERRWRCVCSGRGRARRSGCPTATVIEQLWREFTDLGPLENHVVETATQSADATADMLSERLQVSLLLP